MKICVISDTHSYHEHVKIPLGNDVLIHCGDFSNDIGQKDLRDFCIWLEKQPAKNKIFIAGNHDGALQLWPDLAQAMIKEYAPSAIYLQDSGCEIEGIKFYGSPFTPEFYNWYFMRKRGEDIKKHWDAIPSDTDVLITHGPPFGVLDVSGVDLQNCGCNDLWNAVEKIQPKVHCFGHIHHSYGTKQIFWDKDFSKDINLRKKTTFINSSICDEAYKPIRKPFQFEI